MFHDFKSFLCLNSPLTFCYFYHVSVVDIMLIKKINPFFITKKGDESIKTQESWKLRKRYCVERDYEITQLKGTEDNEVA